MEIRSKAWLVSLSCFTYSLSSNNSSRSPSTTLKLYRNTNLDRVFWMIPVFSPYELIMQITEIRYRGWWGLGLFQYKSLKSEIALTLKLISLGTSFIWLRRTKRFPFCSSAIHSAQCRQHYSGLLHLGNNAIGTQSIISSIRNWIKKLFEPFEAIRTCSSCCCCCLVQREQSKSCELSLPALSSSTIDLFTWHRLIVRQLYMQHHVFARVWRRVYLNKIDFLWFPQFWNVNL